MANLLKGKICIITGAGRGIGKAVTELFADNGAIVYAVDIRKDFEFKGRENIIGICLDVTNEVVVKQLCLEIKKQHRTIDVLVNNAAVEHNELIGMIDTQKMKETFNVNVFGTINMLQLVSRVMSRQEKGGSIINIGSLTAIRGNAGQLVYSATKGAVISLTKSAAKELAGKKIRVNAIAPGLTDTEMMRKANQDKLKSRIDNICMGRLARPEDIANACLFFAADMSEYISGQILAVDGCTIM